MGNSTRHLHSLRGAHHATINELSLNYREPAAGTGTPFEGQKGITRPARSHRATTAIPTGKHLVPIVGTMVFPLHLNPSVGG